METTIQLQYPVKLASGKNLAEIHLRRPKVRDLKSAQKLEDADMQELTLIASLTSEKLTTEDLEELDLADYAKIQQTFQGMVGGKKPVETSDGLAGSVV